MSGEDSERRMDSGYMRAQFEQIQATLCELRPLPTLVSKLSTMVEDMVAQVKAHDVTLYGERSETGLVGRVEKIEVKLNQVMAVAGVIGSAIILWLLGQWLGLIHP